MRPSLITSIGSCLLRDSLIQGFQPQAAMNCCDEIFKLLHCKKSTRAIKFLSSRPIKILLRDSAATRSREAMVLRGYAPPRSRAAFRFFKHSCCPQRISCLYVPRPPGGEASYCLPLGSLFFSQNFQDWRANHHWFLFKQYQRCFSLEPPFFPPPKLHPLVGVPLLFQR